MSTIKYAFSAVVAMTVLTVGLAVPVGAQSNSNTGSGSANQTTSTTNNTTSNSPSADRGSNAFTISGDCNGVFISEIEQDQTNDQGALNAAGLGSNNTASSNQSSNQNQNAQPSFTLHCERVTNHHVTNMTEGHRKQVAAAPKGGVDAGAGGAASSLAGTLMGLASSAGSLGYGVLRLRRR